jgi:hypothetical protein
MMKADEKMKFENERGKMEAESYSHFEKLVAKVEVLQETVELICRILKENDLTKVTEEHNMTPDFEDETYRKLEEGDE